MYCGKILCGMAAFKEHCMFGFWHQGMTGVLGADGQKADMAMGTFGRITSLDDLPSDRKMTRYIKAAVALHDSGAPSRPRPARKPAAPLAVPGDLATALKKNKAAASTFEKFSPSHRKEYIEWVTEARRDETRQKRLATTLEWLAEGKSRNWKIRELLKSGDRQTIDKEVMLPSKAAVLPAFPIVGGIRCVSVR